MTHFRGEDGAIFDFILSRIDDECPIDVLDLTQCCIELSLPLDFLEEATGLKVLWKTMLSEDTFEYICGSGNPEGLHACM